MLHREAMRVLHISPHPDDELLGAPAVLMALTQAGHQVVNLAVSLGAAAASSRREHELREASARAGFALRVLMPPLQIRGNDDPQAAQALLTHELVRGGSHNDHFDLLIAPSPHDGHHGHELVGRSAVAAATALRVPLWIWGLWSDLPVPTILHPFEQPLMDRIADTLTAYTGEIARNDYRRMLAGRAQANAISGPERVFGFGSPGIAARYAEVLCEVVPSSGAMLLGAPRLLDPLAPLATPTTTDLSPWLHASSLRAQLRR